MGNLPNPHSIAPASSVMNVAGYKEQYQAKQDFGAQYMPANKINGHVISNPSGIPSEFKKVIGETTVLVEKNHDGTLDISVYDSSPTTKYNLTYETTTNDATPVVETVTTKELLPGAEVTPQASPVKEGYHFGGWTNEPDYMPAQNFKVTGLFTKLLDSVIAWSADSATAVIGGTNTFPTLSNAHSVEVTYEIDDPEVATINASTGEITLVAAGTAHVSAVFAGDDTYEAKTVTYELTVETEP